MPVEVVACMLADKNSWKRLQFQLFLQCAPLFKGYKVACITNVRREDMRNMHLLLNGTGICYRALTFCRDKYLVLLYRPAQLKTYLKQPEVKTFLADYGYEENSLEKVLERLSLRVREHSKNEIEFPHEIGIFLNYPLEDVRGFIEHKGQDSLFCGYWKVYHDPEKAKQILDDAGIVHFGYDETAVMDVKGIKVGLVGIYELYDHLEREQQLKDNIAKVKADGAQLIVAIFHWGNETETVPDSNQTTLGRIAIDEGADLVCGHHPHVLQGIETYKGRNIVYSLGNFCFGGNSSPSDMDTMIYQQTFTIDADGVKKDNVTNIIPCSISSADGYNNYQPTPATGDEATRIKSKIDERSAAIPTADSTAKSSGDTGSSDTVSADDASGITDTSDESESDTDSDFSDESDGSDYDTSEDYDTSDEEDYSSDEEADFSDNSDE